MSRTKTPLGAADYAVLGVLSEAPAHGYRIAQRFAPGQELGLLCPMDQSNVYALLHDLERQDFIAGRQEAAGARPPRTVFQLLDEGCEQLALWLNEPVDPLRRLRLDFLLKLFFLGRRDPVGASALLERQLTGCERYLERLDGELAALAPESFERLIVESKRAALAGVTEWLRREQVAIDARAHSRAG